MTQASDVSRPFTIGQVLTLACASTEADQMFCSYGDLLAVVGFMLSDVPLADHLPAAIERCRPEVLKQHPDLMVVQPPTVNATDTAVLSWLAAQERVHGTELSLTPLEVAS
ncbi:hypothetical protein [Mycobacterium aquaticum]|uniref:Uncharacterized protein n=1 Tax=Mycobacterium aquaticum TaxID=1927124 RepID=A0A1X0A4D6_9MYCO|nr:hypothetical protein [Mycobacterium aquaticum]ORA24929.1 hypothetical protein BST13_33720 [Mycobacterium aquaticum]